MLQRASTRAALAAVCLVTAVSYGAVTSADVAKVIARSRQSLLNGLKAGSSWGLGHAALDATALLTSGVPADDKVLGPALERIVFEAGQRSNWGQYYGTYESGAVLMLLGQLKKARHRDLAETLVGRLEKFQLGNGGWGDNSRTQLALLGLKEAHDLGLTISKDLVRNARRCLETDQNSDGGWGYTGPRCPPQRASYGSMTAAGVSALILCDLLLREDTGICGRAAQSDNSLQAGLRWLGDNFRPAGDCYFLYSIERVGMLLGQPKIGDHDWYREGAAALVRERSSTDSAFKLLFLAKGSAPLAVQKLRYRGEWNPDQHDAEQLVQRASKDLARPLAFQFVDTSASAEELCAAPLLYIQGHGDFAFDAPFRKKLKEYADGGGYVLASACCGRSSFANGFRSEMKRLYPETEFAPIAADHPIYGAHFALTPNGCALQGLNTGCRTPVLLATRDLCCAWGGCRGCQDKNSVEAEAAFKLGVNIVAYAIADQSPGDKLDFSRAGDRKWLRSVTVGQLHHGGCADPDPAALPNLGSTLAKQMKLKTEVLKRRVELGVTELGDFPLLYITGHHKFEYTDEQIRVLRSYLDNGGFLFADACCGSAEFDRAFRALCATLYPSQALERLPADHALFAAPFKLEAIKYRPEVLRREPGISDRPQMDAIVVDGAIRVAYSRFGLGCGLQGHACRNCLGLEAADGYRMATNILYYATSH